MPFYLGFDTGAYPGNAVMQSLKSSTPLSFAGFCLARLPDTGTWDGCRRGGDAQGHGVGPGSGLLWPAVAATRVSLVEPHPVRLRASTVVTITGSGFSYASAVRFGTKSGTALTIVSDTKITVTAPAHRAVTVTVTNPMGPSAAGLLTRFTYTAAPAPGPVPVPVPVPIPPDPHRLPRSDAAAVTGVLTAAQGTADAAQAVADAGQAKLASGSVIYLDVEAVGTLPPAWMSYITAWVAGVQASAYRPGVYCFHSSPATQIAAALTQPIPFWIFFPVNSGSVTVDANTETAPDPGILRVRGRDRVAVRGEPGHFHHGVDDVEGHVWGVAHSHPGGHGLVHRA